MTRERMSEKTPSQVVFCLKIQATYGNLSRASQRKERERGAVDVIISVMIELEVKEVRGSGEEGR